MIADDLGSKMKEKGWEQGSFVPISCVCEEGYDVAIMISHSCDIVHSTKSGKKEEEPFVEILLAKQLADACDGNCMSGRNARKYHLNLSVNGKDKPHEILYCDHIRVDRLKLAEYSPETSIKFIHPNELEGIKRWMARRYIRIALPDAFNDILKKSKAAKKIKNQFKQANEYLDEIRIRLRCPDESKSDSFELDILGMCKTDDSITDAQKALGMLTKELCSCDGIAVSNCQALVANKILLSDYRQYHRWTDYDYLSNDDEGFATD